MLAPASRGSRAGGRPGDHAAVHRQLGLAEACTGRRQRALSHFKRALEHEPDDAATLHIVANFQQALGLDDEADASYRRALKLKPLITIPAIGWLTSWAIDAVSSPIVVRRAT